MTAQLEDESYLRIQKMAEGKGLHVGFRFRYPSGGIAGNSGGVLGYEAMNRTAAEALIAAEAARLGISDEGFTLLPFIAEFVK